MDKLQIHGPCRLAGTIQASGAKNAALPALTASLLATAPVTLENVPRVQDIRTMLRLLDHLGVKTTEARVDGTVLLEPATDGASSEALYELVKTMRASVLVLGPLLAKRGYARVSLPGGCAIGVRPIDQHLKAFEAMGAEIVLEHGYVIAQADRLHGAHFRFDMPTVTGTENAMMAASLADGTTVLENCAQEPEITDLADLLRTFGAHITGDGTDRIEIEGVESLGGGQHTVIPDRIETGTYLIGAALTSGDVTVEKARPEHLGALLTALEAVGAQVTVDGSTIRVVGNGMRAVDVSTAPHPGFPTDLQAQWMALATRATGTTEVCETIFENRFQHAPELMRMGATIAVDDHCARIIGPAHLSGAKVMATDLRASACLVLAGLAAEGETVVDRIYHLDRGYERMEEKLRHLGADVVRLS
ncbi:MAG: UDP-N-acetylglucosamine 1-carboxyvinyltransferase [Acidobacteriota bacterium]